jgi:hypothetical protein
MAVVNFVGMQHYGASWQVVALRTAIVKTLHLARPPAGVK